MLPRIFSLLTDEFGKLEILSKCPKSEDFMG
jgi:hypothetical protein